MSKRSICMVGVLLALLLALAAIPAAALAPPSAALEPASAATGERTRSTVVAAGFAPAAAYLPEAVIGAGQMEHRACSSSWARDWWCSPS